MKKKKRDCTDQILEYILRCGLEELREITVERMARLFNISPSFLMRQIKKSRDFTLGDFIIKEKMIRASSMLENEEVTIKEISRRLGFSTHGYFIRAFKKFYGIVPNRYRECKRNPKSNSECRMQNSEIKDKR